jgi:hypothetical protein
LGKIAKILDADIQEILVPTKSFADITASSSNTPVSYWGCMAHFTPASQAYPNVLCRDFLNSLASFFEKLF